MNTTTNLRVRFARKPIDLDDLLNSVRNDDRPEPVEVTDTKELTTAEYDHFAKTLLEDRD